MISSTDYKIVLSKNLKPGYIIFNNGKQYLVKSTQSSHTSGSLTFGNTIIVSVEEIDGIYKQNQDIWLFEDFPIIVGGQQKIVPIDV